MWSLKEISANITLKTLNLNPPGSALLTFAPPPLPLLLLGSCGRRSSASMLHRLLTLPSQLLEEDDGGEAGTADSLVTLGGDGPRDAGPEGAEAGAPKDEEDEGGEEDKGRKVSREALTYV